ncbi:hypothetical protein [Halocalculus aciditolerans]|uniref:Uncharacterized protein n=1 Tax=Halocalculus aciditolerans TaxID=1383812 RepID=A0A830F6V8_9EURY|nr:hypothetical protein [Halocalculus aciditolerans]GGL60330.1 hypothetical protein GCM10009039_18220 [Halocalculus aciditolerans]
MPSDRAGIASAEFREVSEDRLTDNRRTYPLAPFLEGRALKRYITMKRRYPHVLALDDSGDLPPRFELTKYCENLVGGHGSRVARKAVAQGSLSVLSFMSGVIHRETDFSVVEEFSRIVHHLRRDGYMQTICGQTNAGKTNWALLLAALYLRDDPDAHLVANLGELDWQEDSLNERTHFADTTEGIRSVAEAHENVIAVLDEMSSEANAQTNNYEVNEELYPLITAKAKLGLRIINIGHREDVKDIAPAIHTHCTHVVRMEREAHDLADDVYRAHFYGGVDGGELVDHAFSVDPVPEVSATYNPDEKQEFSLSS